MERLTLHNITSAFDYAKSNLSQEDAAKIYTRLAELEDKIESGELGNIKQAVKEFAEKLKNIYLSKHWAVFANTANKEIKDLITEFYGVDE